MSTKAADISIWTEPKPALLFTGENREVRLFLKNPGDTARKVKLESRLFQVATSVAAPLGERAKWKEVSLEGNQTIVDQFPISLPAVRGATSFVLKFYEEGKIEETGSAPLVAFPEDVLAELKEIGKKFQIAVLDEENFLTPVFTKGDWGVVKTPSLDQRVQSDKAVLLIVVAGKGMQLERATEDLGRWTAGVLWIRRPNLNTQELPIELTRKGNARILSAERNLFEDFAGSPAAQLNLLRCLRRIVKEEL